MATKIYIPQIPKPVEECPYCHKISVASFYFLLYHFDNCSKKPISIAQDDSKHI